MSARSEPRAPVRYAAFRRLVFASGVSTIGSGVQAVAAGFLAFHLTHNAGAVGLLALLALGPAALLSEAAGALAVALGPRRVAMVLYTLRALPWAVVAAIAAAGRITFLELAVATGVGGVLGVSLASTCPSSSRQQSPTPSLTGRSPSGGLPATSPP